MSILQNSAGHAEGVAKLLREPNFQNSLGHLVDTSGSIWDIGVLYGLHRDIQGVELGV